MRKIICLFLVAFVLCGCVSAPKNKTVGDTVSIGDVDIKLVSVREVSGVGRHQPDNGNVFVSCEFEIKNGTTEKIVAAYSDFSMSADGTSVDKDWYANSIYKESEIMNYEIAPMLTKRGFVVFEVPNMWKNLKITFRLDYQNTAEFEFSK